jgi:hypothetical protein
MLMKTFNKNINVCELNQTMGMAQRAHTAQTVLKLIINGTNTFLRFQVSRYLPFSHWRTWNVPFFSFQKSGHSSIVRQQVKFRMPATIDEAVRLAVTMENAEQ